MVLTALAGIAVVGPAHAGEGKGAIEARVALVERGAAVVGDVRLTQLAVRGDVGRQQTVSHGEHVD